ncbi:coiled-coil domain-containing protein [Algoriphagus sediminis]|uniref:Uncharacterized protein n=1 Tax=Algoriphagus sediminis TaxID=3057113 RepID=A0ABT7YGK7_9BACT|nr:hypothetical protein [Algoriphagus sediminis]MDN3205654.1 hypothetical protein [Algoriphagus sediminis]
MSKISEIQEEFETLIDQLEQLKSINEITTSNSNSAKKTIKEVEKLIKSIDELVVGLNKDFDSRHDLSLKSQKELKEVISALQNVVEDHQKSLGSITTDFTNRIEDEVKSLPKKINSTVQNVIDHINSLKAEVENEILVHRRSTREELNELRNHFIQEMDTRFKELEHKQSQLFEEKFSEISTHFNSGIEELNSDNEKNHKFSTNLIYGLFALCGIMMIILGYMVFR